MLDLLIVLGFVAYAVGSGLASRKKASEGLGEYFLAGKTLGGWRAGFSMAATQFAADTPLLVMGLVATGGVFLLWRLWIYGVAFLLMAFVFAIGWRRSGVLTDAQFTEVRYSGRGVLALRVLKALYYGTLINCVVMAFVLVAAMRIAEVFLPWHEWLGGGVHGALVGLAQSTGLVAVLGTTATGLAPEIAAADNLLSIVLILTFTTLYSTTGGLRAVVATDVVQFWLAMVGTAVYAYVVVDAAGGLGGLTDRVTELYGAARASELLSFSAPDTAWGVLGPFLTIIGLQWFFQMNSDPLHGSLMSSSNRPLLVLVAFATALAGCGGLVGGADGAPGASPASEATAGWVDLFDGATLDGWRGYGRADVPSAWRVEDGAIRLVPGTGDGGDLVAEGTWGDFELELDWRLAPCGNSGIFYRGEERPGGPVYQSAPEYQLLDDACHPDGQYPSHRAGAIYDLYVPTEAAARPAGEWNRTRIVARGAHVEHWLNGQKVAEAEMGSPGWDARVAASKFRSADAFPGFGTYRAGVIALQDHGDELWVRAVRVRPLD